MKKFLLISFMILVTLLAACGDKSSSDNGGSKDRDVVELTFTTWGSEGHIAMYEELLEEFYEENPNIKVKIESIPHADYQQKLSVLAAGNELPDVGWVAERMVPQFINNQILREITEITEDKEFDFEDYIPSTLELWQHDGGLYGLPFSTPPMIIYYNKTMFEDAGVETPNELAAKGEWTWEQFEEVAKAISTGEGVNRKYGARLFNEWTNFATMPSHTFSYGGEMFSDDMSSFEWNSDEGIATFELLNRMMFEDKSHVPPGENVNFESGNVGMFTFMYSYIANVRGITDFEWDIAPLPKGPEGRVPLLGQAGLAAFEGSDHPEEALKLLQFLGSKTGIQASSQFFVPARKSVLESDEFINVENNPPRESIELAVINEMGNGFIYPLHEDWAKIESEIVSGFDKLFAQMATPEEILAEMEEKINPLLQ
ncbi:ABC transporter substrate-binding protein [Ornithinibacillus halotolerans]|uniref:ABC transporter substrate-binding protein n=1 Tax=Ornithinibacillus halotolerans TaxID=1274357 RepID=A0A916SBA8_9BACI|nr:sugar ABC transporter substrate-binding protein [Ornithinibacillus halotolerans]GGA91992.1 ABC transporter substrate-binding protein [Ornithinibacillus halotolerans]